MAHLAEIDHLHWLMAGAGRGIAAALAIAAASAWLGARQRWPALASAACGLAILAGWATVLGLADRRFLPFALAALLVALFATLIGHGGKARPQGRNGRALVLLGVLAAFGGWWLAGAERSWGMAVAHWRAEGVILLACFLLGAPLLAADRWLVAAAAASLAAALVAVGVPGAAPLLALAVAAAALGAGGMAGSSPALLPAIAAIGLLAGAAILGNGRLLHGHVAPVQAVVLAPLATAWLATKLLQRLRRAGGAAPALASLAALTLTALLGFTAAALAGLR